MYFAFATSAFQTKLAYRGQVWAQVFGELISVFAKVAIWMSVYGGMVSVDGITLNDMITYGVLGGTVIAAWEWQRLLNTIGQQIKSGDVAVFLIKPLRYPLMMFSAECGNLGFRLIAVVLPTVVVTGMVYGLLPPASVFHGAMFAAYWALSFFILFLMSAALGLLAFWLMTSFSLEWLLRSLISIFSGTFIPLWFFPEGIAQVIRHLPFAWIGFYPMAVYLGKMDVNEVLIYFAFGLGWAALLALAVALLWQRASRRIVVQGG